MQKKKRPQILDYWLYKSLKDVKNAKALLESDPELGDIFSTLDADRQFHMAANLVHMKRGSLQEYKFWGAILIAVIGIAAKFLFNIKF